jgi:hypothetical protein
MAQYHNYVWWIEQFKGKFLAGKMKQRPPMSVEQAREFIAFYEKRGGGSARWKMVASRAFKEAYGVDYLNPRDFKEHQAEERIRELERQIAEKEAKLAEHPPVEEVPDAPVVTDKVLSVDEFEVKWRKDRGFASDYSFKPVEKAQFARAWKKYSGE